MRAEQAGLTCTYLRQSCGVILGQVITEVSICQDLSNANKFKEREREQLRLLSVTTVEG